MSAKAEISRRAALKLFAAGAAASLAGCSRPNEEILPYVDMPEGMVAGEPQYYATSLALGGYARGVIVKAVDGRPIKVSGNPRHPASLGATDIFGEAEIMALYDPERSGTIRGPNSISGWSEFFGELLARMDRAKSGAAPLHILTSTVASPTLLARSNPSAPASAADASDIAASGGESNPVIVNVPTRATSSRTRSITSRSAGATSATVGRKRAMPRRMRAISRFHDVSAAGSASALSSRRKPRRTL